MHIIGIEKGREKTHSVAFNMGRRCLKKWVDGRDTATEEGLFHCLEKLQSKSAYN
ncbi:MAG: hypothetical protein Hens3KO_03080 [Henriciella sp.]